MATPLMTDLIAASLLWVWQQLSSNTPSLAHRVREAIGSPTKLRLQLGQLPRSLHPGELYEMVVCRDPSLLADNGASRTGMALSDGLYETGGG